MAEISATMVKDLREKTGVGMMECKKALADAEGDMEKAIKILRERGLKKADKRADRDAGEGVVEIATNGDATTAAIIELNSETDFAAKNDEFRGVATALAQQALKSKSANGDALLSAAVEGKGKSGKELVQDLQAKIGEKIELKRADLVEADVIAGYIHPPGKIGVLIGAKLEGIEGAKRETVKEELRRVAMHVASTNPKFLSPDDVDEATLATEREIATNIARNEGKPDAILPKIVEGKIKAYQKDNCLLTQIHVVDGKRSVGDVMADACKVAGGKVTITRFVRFQVGS